MRLLLLGASGFVGTAFRRELDARGLSFVSVSRNEYDYARFSLLTELLRSLRPAFVINAAGYTGKPNVDACEIHRTETIAGNVLLPQTISHACEVTNIPWGQVSSGCLYQGAMLESPGGRRVVQDLRIPELRDTLLHRRDLVQGFSESDPPNFSFGHTPCSFYSGAKAVCEEMLSNDPRVYLWRLRLPFNSLDHDRNYLTKLQKYSRVYDNYNSLSHLDQFVGACLDLWRFSAPFGVYNITNPGFVSSREVVMLITRILHPERTFEFWEDDASFYSTAASAPRSNCVLDSSKLLRAGIELPNIHEALETVLKHWQPRN